MVKKKATKYLAAAVVVIMALSVILVLSGCAATEASTEAGTNSENIIPGTTAVTVYQPRN